MATSDSSIEVWWEAVPLRTRVIGQYELPKLINYLLIRDERLISSPFLSKKVVTKYLRKFK